MRLNKLLENVKYREICGNIDIDIKDLSIDSRNIVRGGLFVAVQGFKIDGHDYVREAINKGAVAVIINKKMKLDSGVTQVVIDETRQVLPVISSNFFGHPSRSLNIIGITGTNGKTTTCYLINSILKSAGIKNSMITTFKSFIGEDEMKFERTTPESIDLHRFFSRSRERGSVFVCMEVSSHSIDLHRVDHIGFNFLIFTNLSQDHLDYHGNIENYFEVKSRLFDARNNYNFGNGKVVINIDDSFGLRLFEDTGRKKVSYAINSRDADIKASDIISSISGIKMKIAGKNIEEIGIETSLCGIFNVYNILAAFAVCLEAGIDTRYIVEGIRKIGGFGGRFEKIEDSSGRTVIIDYAHTPDGLENVLKTARGMLADRGRLISVFGCGGDRDKNKRRIMGSISVRLADFSIITTDNPRSEEPDSIIDMIEEGFREENIRRYKRITDRKEAIFEAMDMAGCGDVVLIAGKGHENYQEFENGRMIPFSDLDIVSEYNEDKRKNKSQ